MTDSSSLWQALQKTARDVLDEPTAKRFLAALEERTGQAAPAGGEAVEVITAEALDDGRRRRLTDSLRRRYGEGTTIDFRLEPAILGGYVLRTADWLLDASVRGQLARLTEEVLASGKGATDLSTPEAVRRFVERAAEYEPAIEWQRIGRVLEAGDGIARIAYDGRPAAGDVVEFLAGDGSTLMSGMASNIEDREIVAMALVGESEDLQLLQVGGSVRMTGRVIDVPVGDALVGRVVNALGEPIDGRGPLRGEPRRRPMERIAPRVPERQNVSEPVLTGIKAIDSMIPIGRGQRELIIGDRQTGKTAIALDTIINQNDSDILCIYVAIGQKRSQVAQIVEALEARGAMAHTIVVAAGASESAALQYLAPYAGCAMGEEIMERGGHALIIYDDLSKHAWAYRQLALLFRRPPGREAYPGDVFYLHSRLLERAAKLSDERGGGSLTALPIVETQLSDVSAYIPTNIISITDGQIYLEPELFYAGIRPAVNAGLSVSRVGGDAQHKAMKQVAGKLRLDMAAYRELAAFAQFGSDLDVATRRQLERGARLQEVLKQRRYEPMAFADQVTILFAVTNDFADHVPVSAMATWEEALLAHLRATHPDIRRAIEERLKLDEELAARLGEAITGFKGVYQPTPDA